MIHLTTPNPALILVDLQQGFRDVAYWGGNRNNPGAEENAGRLLRIWRTSRLPLFHIRHRSANPASPLAEGSPGYAFEEPVLPLEGEPVISKRVNSAFIGTDLKKQLDRQGITEVVLVGLTTDHCVSTTTRMAANYGYAALIVADATATFDRVGADGTTYPAELVHQTALASLHVEFATVVSTRQLVDFFSRAAVGEGPPWA